MTTIEDKIDLLEAAVLKTLGVLCHVREVGYTAKNVQDWLKEELATLEEDMDWEEIDVEPVAWMVVGFEGVPVGVYLDKEEAIARSEGGGIVPLYDLQRDMDEDCDDDD